MYKLALNFYPNGPTIAQQLDKQGFTYKKKRAISFEKVKNSINTLIAEGFITSEEGFEMATKLANQINDYIKTRIREGKIKTIE